MHGLSSAIVPPLTVCLHTMCALIWPPRDRPNYTCGCATSTVPHLRRSCSSITSSPCEADTRSTSSMTRPPLLRGTVPATLYKLVQLKLCRLWLTWRGIHMRMLTGWLKVRRSESKTCSIFQSYRMIVLSWQHLKSKSDFARAVCVCGCFCLLALTVWAQRCSRIGRRVCLTM